MAEEPKKTTLLGTFLSEMSYNAVFELGKNIISNKFGKKGEEIAGVFNQPTMLEIGANEVEIANLEGDITRRMIQRKKASGWIPRALNGNMQNEYTTAITEARARIAHLKNMNDQIKLKNKNMDPASAPFVVQTQNHIAILNNQITRLQDERLIIMQIPNFRNDPANITRIDQIDHDIVNISLDISLLTNAIR